MSHPQAFHTSCRNGLAAHPGFQFNAASPSLDRSLLSRLASQHAGYHVPRDMPLEPTAGDLARFPVALKVSPVDGAGVVVSRTTYVGREFRGRDGKPDEGRFGNYFSHIVVGAGAEPFDGLLGIELWDAPHWTDSESPEPDLIELERLEPGPLDVDHVASILSAAPRGVMAAVLDAALAALDGGPRVVLVEADCSRASAWIGWISYALPAAQAQGLTFTTFDGRPRYADDVHVCVTTPACDTAFAQHEIGHSVRLLDVGDAVPGDRPSLYARVALVLAEQGTDALATAIRTVPPDAGAGRRGAWLAVAGGLTELVEGDELPAVVDLLRELTARGDVARAAATAKELPADTAVDRAALVEWAALHRAAREHAADEDSRSLAATALARIVPFAGELPDGLPQVAHDAPTQPAVGNLAPWLSAVEGAAGTVACAALILDGLRLGLVGVNAAVDRRLAAALSDSLAQPAVEDTMQAIARQAALHHIVAAVTETVAERAATDEQARGQLRRLGRLSVARATLERRAREQPTFERMAAWLRAEVDQAPAKRRSAAAQLAELATEARDEAEIRELWGPGGPGDEREHVELLGAYVDCEREPPLVDGERALMELMTHPLTKATVTDPLGATLDRCGDRLHEHPAYIAWWVATTTPGPRHRFAEWARSASAALRADERYVPDARWRELCQVVCLEVLRQRQAHDYAEGIATLRAQTARYIEDGLVGVLTDRFREGEDNAQLVAELFADWRRVAGADGAALVDGVLARAAQAVKRRDIERVEEHLPQWLLESWKAWLELHPPRTTVVGRAFGRREKGQKEPEAEQ